MSLPTISICGVVDFQKIDRSQYSHIISIWHPSAQLNEFQQQMYVGFPQAELHFATYDDIEICHGEAKAPSRSDVQDALKFASTLTTNDHLLIHCMAGISRSTATAMSIISHHYGPGSEREAAITVREIRPIANPNRLILSQADELLERHGALVNAADEVFGHSLGQMNKGWED